MTPPIIVPEDYDYSEPLREIEYTREDLASLHYYTPSDAQSNFGFAHDPDRDVWIVRTDLRNNALARALVGSDVTYRAYCAISSGESWIAAAAGLVPPLGAPVQIVIVD